MGKILGRLLGILGLGVTVGSVIEVIKPSEPQVTTAFDWQGLLLTLAITGVITLIITWIIKRRKN